MLIMSKELLFSGVKAAATSQKIQVEEKSTSILDPWNG